MNHNDTITAAEAHPAPPIPSDVDLRDFRFMPLDVVQLHNSETLGNGRWLGRQGTRQCDSVRGPQRNRLQ
jgi:hypothetical protein